MGQDRSTGLVLLDIRTSIILNVDDVIEQFYKHENKKYRFCFVQKNHALFCLKKCLGEELTSLDIAAPEAESQLCH